MGGNTAVDLSPAGNLPRANSFTSADATSVSVGAPSEPPVDAHFPGKPTFTFGPLIIHTAGLARQFRLRQKVDLNDRLSAAAGFYYDFKSSKVGPTGLLTYRLDSDKTSKSRLELNDRQILARKGWDIKIKNATVGVSAEASINYRDADGKLVWGIPVRPDLHVSLDHGKPLKYELIGIGAVLLLNLPVKLNNKEVELPLPGVWDD